MKKLLVVAAVIVAGMFNAQTNVEKGLNATKSGNYTVGLNTTSLGYTNSDGHQAFNIGASAGAFVTDGLALVASLGYKSDHVSKNNSNDWYYGAGVKYYVGGVLPLQVDWKGSTGNSYHPSTSFVGVQGGYAWFPFNNFSVEPNVRYDFSTKDEYKDVFSAGLGFNLFF